MKLTRSRASRVAVILLATMGLVGCAMNNSEEPVMAVSLEEAKADSLAVQDEIVAFVPEEHVTETSRSDKRSLLSCGEGMYLWPGGTTLLLDGQLDQQGIIDQIAARFESAPEWAVKPLTNAELVGVELRRDDNLGLFVNFSQSGDRFSITGFSTCFPFEPKLGHDY